MASTEHYIHDHNRLTGKASLSETAFIAAFSSGLTTDGPQKPEDYVADVVAYVKEDERLPFAQRRQLLGSFVLVATSTMGPEILDNIIPDA